MKYSRIIQDDIVNQMEELKDEIRRYKEKKYLSEWEMKSLIMAQEKLDYLRRM